MKSITDVQLIQVSFEEKALSIEIIEHDTSDRSWRSGFLVEDHGKAIEKIN